MGYVADAAYDVAARLYGLRDAPRAAAEMIRRIGLNGREEQLAGELSGGWKQRLALAHRDDREAYTAAKGPFVAQVLGRAGRAVADGPMPPAEAPR